MELALDRGHVGEDVRVVVFEVVEDRDARVVMHELRALVEERGVVLVRFNDKRLALPEPCRHTEIARHAADQKTRRQAGAFQQMRQQAGRGGLAVGAGHRQHVALGQHGLAQPLRAGDVAQTRIEHVLDGRIAARHRVADHHQVGPGVIGPGLQVFGGVTAHQADAERLELGAHRRIDVRVGTFDRVAQLARERGDPAHEGAADAEDVQTHGERFLETRSAGSGTCAQPFAAAASFCNARSIRAVTSASSPTPSTTCSLPRLA